jgi:hypothetical protein
MGSVVVGLKDAFRHRGFVLCVLVLSVSAAGLEWVVQTRGVRFRKLPLPLRRSFSLLDANPAAMAPYRVVKKSRIPDEVLSALGTDQYISWLLEDTSKPEDDPHRYPVLFVTYYTGKPDQVPHVPDVCYVGGGYTIDTAEAVDVRLDDSNTIPARMLTFVRSELGMQPQPPVLYTFHANGAFYGHRNRVRFAIGNPIEPFAYFSKVEVTFTSAMRISTFAEQADQPDKAESRAAAEAVMRVFLPLLIEHHWPDWANREATIEDSADASAIPETQQAES